MQKPIVKGVKRMVAEFGLFCPKCGSELETADEGIIRYDTKAHAEVAKQKDSFNCSSKKCDYIQDV